MKALSAACCCWAVRAAMRAACTASCGLRSICVSAGFGVDDAATPVLRSSLLSLAMGTRQIESYLYNRVHHFVRLEIPTGTTPIFPSSRKSY